MRKLTDEEIEHYITAGKIAKNVLSYVVDYISSKLRINLLELCEFIETSIIKYNAVPAFPCNICFNEIAAHYTPLSHTEEIIFDKGLLKIDIGVCVDGYIADSAITVARGDEYISIAKKNEEILNSAIDYFRPNKKLSEVGKYIEEEALKNGYKPISNLSGHLIERYNLHAGKSVPNVYYPHLPIIEPWEVYAIEPFLTFQNKRGEVAEADSIRIFSLVKTKKIKDKILDQIRK
ncbi:MAG: M24 family metallopeptidase, partial [Candidatus Geothermarchaeota archaeon]